MGGEQWYHTLDLGRGRITPGWFDARSVAPRLPLPADLTGMRCLDVGTFDGFWAFEMERRGAAEVVAIDVLDPARWDWPAGSDERTVGELARRKRGGAGFEEAKAALGSEVRLRDLSVYELEPAVAGEFDFVYLGSLLLHLRDPVGALERVRSVCRGELLVVDNHDPLLSLLFPRRAVARLEAEGRPWWWQANVSAVVRMLQAAGFRPTRAPQRLRMPAGAGQPRPPLRPATLRRRGGARDLASAWLGDPHVAVLARPA